MNWSAAALRYARGRGAQSLGAKSNFAAAPLDQGSTKGKKARKKNRMDAYKLAK